MKKFVKAESTDDRFSDVWKGGNDFIQSISIWKGKSAYGVYWCVQINTLIIDEFNTRDKAVAFAQKLVDLLNETEDLK